MQRGRLLWAQALGFPSLQLPMLEWDPQGLFTAHALRLVLADRRGRFLLHSLHCSRLLCHEVLTLC